MARKKLDDEELNVTKIVDLQYPMNGPIGSGGAYSGILNQVSVGSVSGESLLEHVTASSRVARPKLQAATPWANSTVPLRII